MPAANAIRDAMTRASWIRKMFERGAEMKREHGAENVFDLTLGNPVLEPPAEFFTALGELSRRRDEGLHRYMANAGFPEVRAAIAEQLGADGIFSGLTGNSVIMCVGAGGGLNVALKAILNPDDEVVILAPYFVEYLFYIKNHGGAPVVAETDGAFDIDVNDIASRITPRTRAILINSPNNPTGRAYPEASMRALGEMLALKEKEIGHPIYLIADEPYREIVFEGGTKKTAAAFHPNSMLIYSWSKSLSIPGDRIGYIAINPESDDPTGLADALTFTTRTLGFVNAPATLQLCVAKLLSVTVDIEGYRSKRDRLLAGLGEVGIEFVKPEGTFYIFPKSPDGDDVAFVNRAIEERLLLVPGSGFGRKGYFRISYAVDDRTVDGGLEAFRRLMGKS